MNTSSSIRKSNKRKITSVISFRQKATLQPSPRSTKGQERVGMLFPSKLTATSRNQETAAPAECSRMVVSKLTRWSVPRRWPRFRTDRLRSSLNLQSLRPRRVFVPLIIGIFSRTLMKRSLSKLLEMIDSSNWKITIQTPWTQYLTTWSSLRWSQIAVLWRGTRLLSHRASSLKRKNKEVRIKLIREVLKKRSWSISEFQTSKILIELSTLRQQKIMKFQKTVKIYTAYFLKIKKEIQCRCHLHQWHRVSLEPN